MRQRAARRRIGARWWLCEAAGVLALSIVSPVRASAPLPLEIPAPSEQRTAVLDCGAEACPPLGGLRLQVPQDPAERPVHDFYTPTTGNVGLRNTLLLSAGFAGVAWYGMNQWWRSGFTAFHSGNEGWFGQSTDYGGADKIGHMYANYAITRTLARTLELLGNRSDRALKIGAWWTLGTYTAIEVTDGFSKSWTFSKEDEIMNAVGVGAAVLLERNPKIDRVLDFRLLYWPSGQQGQADPFGDYSAQTYLFVVKAAGVPRLANKGLLRYVEFAVGYGTRGYDPDLGVQGSRHVYAGISLNLSEVLAATVFRGNPESRWKKGTDFFLELVQVPGTAALADFTLPDQ
jgi:Predicted periplasmic lipoprotein (DUF2279)